ncbi:MAG: 30S ribosomal protein S12 methylthiotransferase RimO [Andreesenia angusta]|nr:30S ribosomal protein S12 methylthiotransferase RimO [Andreesenia angusta]
MYRISMVSLGCSKNLIDSELMMGILKNKEYEIIEDCSKADIIIINTCGFIDKAKEESINTILELSEFKDSGNCKCLIVSGCLTQRYKEEILDELPEVDAILGTGNIQEISEIVEEALEGNRVAKFGDINTDYQEDIKREIITPMYSSYIKISEGCDNHCTYCIIPKLRGKYRSRTMDSIITEAKNLVENGTKEIILIAQDTSKYGIDLYGEFKLPELLDELNKIDGLEWIRILYIYPETFTDELILSMKRNEKVLHYVDIPIQHISDRILKLMNRDTDRKSINELINKLRKEIPDIIIRTTLIVGFPGETEKDFDILKDFISEIKFDRLGVFTYSKEENTAAARLPNHISDEVKEERRVELMKIQEGISSRLCKKSIGNKYDVLIEEYLEDGLYIGRTYMDSPEIDGIVYVDSDRELNIGDLLKVKIKDGLEYDLIGDVFYEFSK